MSHSSASRSTPPAPIRLPVNRVAAPPQPLTSFVGRSREVAELCALLRRDDVRLVTLTGPGGVGKTRLAIRVAAEIEPDFVAIWFVSLESIRDPAMVGSVIAQALGLRGGGDGSAWDRIAAFAGPVPALLVLDNMEQVAEAAEELVRLLMRCPDLTVLVTSRVVLHAGGEFDYPVTPLALPGDDSRESPAVELFCQRAQAADPHFTVDAGNSQHVRELCTRLDGLPLAIELAAAHSRMFTPAAICQRLGGSLTLLEGGPRDAPSRLRSIRQAVAWSHDLLSPALRSLFRRLAVFVDGFTLDAAERIGAGEDLDPAWVLSGVEQLLDASLLTHVTGTGEPRLRMLETIRVFAWERLIESGDEMSRRDVHAAYFLGVAREAEAPLIGADAKPWLERLVAEHANLREAVTWSLKQGRADAVLRIAGTVLTYGYAHGDPEEGRVWMERALEAAPDAEPRLRVDALFTASALAQVQGHFEHSSRLSEEAIEIARRHDYPFGEARAQLALGITSEWQGALAEAAERYDEARDRMTRIDASEPRVHWTMLPTANLADIALLRGEYETAALLADEAVARWRAAGYVWGIAQALGTAAAACCARGDLSGASRQYAETLDWWLSCEDGRGIGGTVAGIAAVALARGQIERASRLLGAAWKISEVMGVRYLAHHVHAERVLAAARERLDPRTFAACWDAGQRMTLASAIEEARAAIESGEDRRGIGSGLSAREAEILRLIAAGRSDREIAAGLRISPRTVQTHVARIFFKLGTSTRAESAAYAVRRGFI